MKAEIWKQAKDKEKTEKTLAPPQRLDGRTLEIKDPAKKQEESKKGCC